MTRKSVSDTVRNPYCRRSYNIRQYKLLTNVTRMDVTVSRTHSSLFLVASTKTAINYEQDYLRESH